MNCSFGNGRLVGALLASMWFSLLPFPVAASGNLQLERVILLYRHGVRTPLPGEIQLDEVNGKPWPTWSQAPADLTPHGAAGAKQMGGYDRQRLNAAGLFAPGVCPISSDVWFWANTDQRTIASAQALAEGFAPGCSIAIGHRPQGSNDPLFNPTETGAAGWNTSEAMDSIQKATGGPDALISAHLKDLSAFSQILGCGPTSHQPICDPTTWHGALTLSPDKRRMVLTGPIATTSGTAEAILMAYAQGKPLDDVGWGRITTARLEQLSRLHSLLFDIYARPDYMARRVAGVMSQRIVSLLNDSSAPRLSVMVGSDNNIVALASRLGIHFKMPGYGRDDAPIGGAFGIELWRQRASGRRYTHIFYQAQTLPQLRALKPFDRFNQPAVVTLLPVHCIPAQKGLCTLESVNSLLDRTTDSAD